MDLKKPPLHVSAFTSLFMKTLSQLNVRLYRASGGRIGGVLGRHRVCLLTTIGRKSGLPRTTPLLYMRDGDRVLLVASQGGLPEHPLWFSNLCAHPEVTVTIDGAEHRMRARVVDEAERAALWPRLTAHYRGWGQYQGWTDRVIPVVACEPV